MQEETNTESGEEPENVETAETAETAESAESAAEHHDDAENPDESEQDINSSPEESDAAEEPEEDDAPQVVEIPELTQILEGAILAADKALSIDAMISLFDEGQQPSRAQVRETLDEIEQACEGRGFELKQVASGYRFQVRERYGDWIGKLWDERPPRYTRALLETLALIAYKQPITRGDVEDIRGVAVSTNIIRTLLEREWIRVVGHRDVPGRPSVYATTKHFLDYFNLSSLDELPTLSEIKDLEGVNEELQLEEELIEPRTLDIQPEEDDESVTAQEDANLDDVTNQVNTIQENIKNLFREPEEDEDEDEFDELDDDQAIDVAAEQADSGEPADQESDSAPASDDPEKG